MNGTSAVLVTGGAGYIGSHVAWALHDAGWRAVVLDDLSAGRRELAPADAPFIEGDAGDIELVARLARDHGCGAVMHFAGSIVVSESVAKPELYFRNNTAVTGRLVEACLDAGIERFIYSSTAAVYGQPESVPIGEESPVRPINPYGRSKLMSEWMLTAAATAHRFECVSLRYFNVAGADAGGRTGQVSPAATHLIKIACEAALGRRDGVEIYGEDYDTPDGTCIRDYVHVTDLADAHLAALKHLEGGGGSLTLNCGYGKGASVRQVLAAVEAAAGAPLSLTGAPRRPGDAVSLVADAGAIRDALGWRPCNDDLATIVNSALEWERRLQGAQPAAAEA
ncbi:MAG: UDP-glucose 4-epimerase GalE [Rhodospirillales bacterium]|nr:UDP-glucose 4-epimerase GalE [Rhodospirillales bacterium]